MDNSNNTQQDKLVFAELLETRGFQYHVRLAPGVSFGEHTTEIVRDAVAKNLHRILSPVGGEFDIPVDKLY